MKYLYQISIFKSSSWRNGIFQAPFNCRRKEALDVGGGREFKTTNNSYRRWKIAKFCPNMKNFVAKSFENFQPQFGIKLSFLKKFRFFSLWSKIFYLSCTWKFLKILPCFTTFVWAIWIRSSNRSSVRNSGQVWNKIFNKSASDRWKFALLTRCAKCRNNNSSTTKLLD